LPGLEVLVSFIEVLYGGVDLGIGLLRRGMVDFVVGSLRRLSLLEE
jgi:hypothetical protein